MNKKLILSILIIISILILGFILIKIEYKEVSSGNNISKETDILNISSYDAIVEIEVYSNKNKSKYIINQKYREPNVLKQEIIEPSNIKGLTITSDGDNITVENKLLNLKAVYNNIKENISNLSLISFINEYKEGIESETVETEKEIIMKTKISNSSNKYQMYQNLYIDKTTNLPTKMEILDINKNITVYILYNEIKVNQTEKDELL